MKHKMATQLKRLAFFLLSLTIVLTGIPVIAAAETVDLQGDVDTYDKTGLTRPGYNPGRISAVNLTSVTDITTLADSAAPTAGIYKITNAAGITKLATLVNNGNTFQGKIVYLANDIDMSGVNFTPIGSYTRGPSITETAKPFMGTFDGQGHSICNLQYATSELYVCVGFFGCVETATIRNLVFDESCTFALNVDDGGYNAIGALIGATANVHSTTGTTTVTNFMNRAAVNSQAHAGGVIGRSGLGTVRINVSYFTNYGTINGKNSVSSIIGYGAGGTFSYCVNYGTIIAQNAAGAFSARTNNGYTYNTLINYGAILGAAYAGGILGRFESTAPTATIKNCFNYGPVASTDGSAVLGDLYALQPTVTSTTGIKVTNSGSSTASGYFAGMVWPYDASALTDLNAYDAANPAKAYKITNAEGLAKLATLVNGGNSMEGVTVYLTCDVNMTGVAIAPIGYSQAPFMGIFDGLGHTIHGLSIYSEESMGLFGYTNGAIVQNVIIGADCEFQTTNVNAYIGAIVGHCTNTMLYNVRNDANLSAPGSSLGGIVGYASAAKLISCTNNGNLTSKQFAAGILGDAVSGEVVNVTNNGMVKASRAGGIVGCLTTQKVIFAAAYNHGTIIGQKYAGGFSSYVSVDFDLYNCANYGAVLGESSSCITSLNYNVSRSSTPAIAGSGCKTLNSVGYSKTISDGQKVNVASLLESGVALNIEDYVHATHVGKIKILIIDSAEDMARFAKLINTTTRGVGMTFYLANDIDMSGYTMAADHTVSGSNTFAPIGWCASTKAGNLTNSEVASVGYAMFFGGTFDGQGYSIKNLKLSTDASQNTHFGLFGYLNNATVRNLILDEGCRVTSSVSGSFKMGALAGSANGSVISNVWSRATVTGAGTQIGGLIGRAGNTTFTNCTNNGDVQGLDNVGGFVGFGENVLNYYNCRNAGNITGTTRAGGLTAREGSSGYYVNCVNIGNVTANDFGGAIIGYKWQSGTTYYANCNNYGAISARGVESDALYGKAVDDTCVFEQLADSHFGNIDAYHINQMLDVKYQTKDNGDGTFDLRLVTTVDSLNYNEVVIRFAYENANMGKIDTTFNITKVYSTILGGDITYTPAEKFADTSMYFATYSITGIPNAYKADFTAATKNFIAQAYLVTQNNDKVGDLPIEEIEVPYTYSATIHENGAIIDFGVDSYQYPIGDTGVSVTINYNGWPSVTMDENGVLYAVTSARVTHTCPFGHHVMSKSYDGGKTWTKAVTINDSPVDDRDIGIEYLGNGKMIATYFTAGPAHYLPVGQSITTKDGVVIQGLGTYSGYWNTTTNMNALKAYWSTFNADQLKAREQNVIISYDYGQTWSEPIPVLVSAPHGAIQLSSGELLYVGAYRTPIDLRISNDGGYNWSDVTPVANGSPLSFVEPYVTELPNGRLLAAARAESGQITIDGVKYIGVGIGANGYGVYYGDTDGSGSYTSGEIYYSIDFDKNMTPYGTSKPKTYVYCMYSFYSDDGGQTWTKPKLITDKNGTMLPGSPPEFTVMEDGTVVLSYATRESDDRSEYVILSYDGGMTWDTPIKLITRDPASGTGNDIGYPSTVHLGNGEFVTVYYQCLGGDSFTSFLFTRWRLDSNGAVTGGGSTSTTTPGGLYNPGDTGSAQDDWDDLGWK